MSGEDSPSSAHEKPSQPTLPVWAPTTEWTPARTGTASTGAGGGPVKAIGSGVIGYHKRTFVGHEKVCSDLARAVGASVPEVELGRLSGHVETIAVSRAHGAESVDLPLLQSRDPNLFASVDVQEAIRQASGLLPFHTWVRTDDLKNEHLVIAEEPNGNFTVAAIDFSFSMAWAHQDDPVQAAAGPPALTANPDRGIIEETVHRIENCTDKTIDDILDALPDDAMQQADKERIRLGLKARRAKVREAMRTRGWLP